MRILIAEDEPISRRMLEANLQGWGHQVVITTNGEAARRVLQSEDAPRLAIFDIMMPEMDGLEVCRRVRLMDSLTPPYIILLTAKGDKQDVVRGIEAGANDYLTKPFHRDELRVRLGVGVRIVELQNSLAERVLELESALEEVKRLQGILPICSYCKNVRNDQNYWQRVESYIAEHTEVQFSHSICPGCYEKVVLPQLEARRRGRS